jgi:tocopherol O-methyltransferase
MNSDLHKVSEYYERMTESYLQYGGHDFGWHFGLWDDHTKSVGDALLNSNRILTEGCDLHPGQLILDSGCGVGGLAFYLAQTFGVKVIGVTICQPHVALATQFAEKRGLQHQVEFKYLDFMDLDFKDNTFDFVFNQETFCYASNKDDYLRKIYKALKPGGRWQTVDFFRSGQPLTKEQEEYHRQVQEGWKTAPLACWQDIQSTLDGIGYQDIITRDLSKMAYPSALIFIYNATMLQERLSRTGPPQNPQDDTFIGNATACDGYSHGLIEGAFTYHLVGGAKIKP